MNLIGKSVTPVTVREFHGNTAMMDVIGEL